MVNFLKLFLLCSLMPVSAFATYLPVPQVTQLLALNANVALPANTFRLFAEYNTGSPPFYCTFTTALGVDYVVPAGKRLKVIAWQQRISNHTAASDMQMAFATAATVSGGSTTAPAGITVLGGPTSLSSIIFQTSGLIPNFVTAATVSLDGLYVAAGNYPTMKMLNGNGNGGVVLFVQEVGL